MIRRIILLVIFDDHNESKERYPEAAFANVEKYFTFVGLWKIGLIALFTCANRNRKNDSLYYLQTFYRYYSYVDTLEEELENPITPSCPERNNIQKVKTKSTVEKHRKKDPNRVNPL